ncbi:MAG: type II toxin-antitoxin system PemK/MazF family toxin [Clostridiales bacterium]|jgi:mRNA interferase MazF|nr:type II toxin-antitoxin system PemK/MazF family toxin [Clostridia bacterium]MDD6051401.1 type II toxin-antitoxin system PemK/MazF family toxin [Clostridiales bacterium]
MSRVEQGDLLRIDSFKNPVLVVSNNFFNQSGMALVCPVLKNAVEGPLHIQLKESPVEGYVLCEQVRYVDLTMRRFSKLSATHYYDIMDISDAVMSMFDYQHS